MRRLSADLEAGGGTEPRGQVGDATPDGALADAEWRAMTSSFTRALVVVQHLGGIDGPDLDPRASAPVSAWESP